MKNTMSEKETQELFAEYEHIHRAIELIHEYYQEKIADAEEEMAKLHDRSESFPKEVEAYRICRRRQDEIQWFTDRLMEVFNKLYEEGV